MSRHWLWLSRVGVAALCTLATRIEATSFHTIVIDGANDFAPDETFPTSTPGLTAYCTWDATNLYFGYSAPDIGTNASKWLVWYIDTNPHQAPTTGPGTTNAIAFQTQDWVLPFNADSMLQIKADGTVTAQQVWSGSAWVLQAFAGSATNSGTFMEVRVPLSALGNPSEIYVLGYFLNETSLSELTYGAWPSSSITDGYYSPGTFLHRFGFRLVAGQSPTDPGSLDHPLPVELTSFSVD